MIVKAFRLGIFFLTILIFFRCGLRKEENINSIYFDGDFYLIINSDDSLNGIFNNDFAIEMWVSGIDDSTIHDRVILSLARHNRDILQLREDAKYLSQLIFTLEGNIFRYNKLEDDYRGHRFYHICVTRSGNIIYLYMNGTIIDQFPILIDLAIDKILIGASALGFSDSTLWIGYMDEFRIWSVYKDNSAIQFHYNNPDKLCIHYSESCINSLKVIYRFNDRLRDIIPNEAKGIYDAMVVGNITGINWSSKSVR
ncbi:MAG: hypothetical protein H0Z29_01405 [Candidatus Marinimicrobia bacterium]|nr:hypothetical protein [Candidatus Neomarinimicrobiota bacterium]